MPRKPPPVTSFGPELQEALRKGALAYYEVKLDSDNMAIRFAHRLNSLRAAMRNEDHPDWKQLYRTSVRRRGDTVIISPQDTEFGPALRAALDSIPEPRSSAGSDDSPSGGLDSFLSSLHPRGEK